MEVINSIRDGFPDFSKGQKLIGEFIINNYDKAAFMTAATLGNTVNVSESTVVRFANHLGFNGYKDLQNELQNLVKDKFTTVERLSMTEKYPKDKSPLKAIMDKDRENIKKTIDEIDEESFKQALSLILKSRRVYIVGQRTSSFLASYLGFYFKFLIDTSIVVSAGPQDVFEQLLLANDEDVIIGISYPRYSKRTIEALDFAREKKCKIISITDSLISPAAKYSDITLIASSEMSSIVDSLVAPMSLINALIVSVAMERKEEVGSTFEELENIWKKYNVYNMNFK